MTLTLADSSITQSISILRNVLVHVDNLVFPIDFVVLDTKGDSRGSIILRRPLLATKKANVDVETGELMLKSNKRKVVFKVIDVTPYGDNVDTCYHLEEKSRKVDKGIMRREVAGVRVSLVPVVP